MDDRTKKIVYWALIGVALVTFVVGFVLDQQSITGPVGVALVLVAAFGFGPGRERGGFWHRGGSDG